jgi:hypothetical protein
MKRRALIRFFILKSLKAGAIHTELESVDDREALALPTVKRGRDAFAKGERICLRIPGPKGL